MSESKVAKNRASPIKSGGRQKGTPNKPTQYVYDMCAKHNFDPIEFMIMVAKNDWKALGYSSAEIERLGFGGQVAFDDRVPLALRVSANKELMAVMYPKRKAVEITGDVKDSTTFNFAYGPESLKKKLDESS